MTNGKIIKTIGIAVTVIGFGVNILTDWVNEKKMDERIEEKVNEALAKRDANEYLFEPRSNWSKQAIMERSYERWAVDEILLTIMDHPLTEADFVIEGFILKMEFFLHMSGNQANNLIFQVAENTAEALLGLIL